MERIYIEGKDTYEAANERIEFIFKNFKKIYLSFSGGKDSGVMLNLVLDYMKANSIKEKIGIMVMDNEANYKLSLSFMIDILDENRDYLDIYWCCLPITLPCTVSSYMTEWQCWGNNDRSKWINEIPDRDYVVTWENHLEKYQMTFFKENMNYDEFWDNFGDWYGKGERTACLIGIRTAESLNRFRAIMNDKKQLLKGQMWTKKNTKYVYNCYPIYDMTTDDVWTANAKFGWKYNELYDLFYMAGISVYKMRVASPFMSESKSSLNMYRVIDPDIWVKLCGRVQGANFVATYGKQLNYHSFKLPEGHTWKSFTKFLLDTLPDEVSKNFKMRFAQSLRYWSRVGRGVSDELIEDLKKNNIEFRIGEKTKHGRKNKYCVKMLPPDHLDMLRAHNSEITSWKRFAMTILKNDHTCKYMGLAPTQEQAKRQREIMEKYKNI
jgi:predicted phosphoadenosine phosphosulfate sulfurtransferase